MAIRRMRLNRGKEGDTGVIIPSASVEGPNSGERELCPFNDDIIDEICQMAGWPDLSRLAHDDIHDDIREYTKRAVKLAISTKNMRDALNCQLSDPNDPPPTGLPPLDSNRWMYADHTGQIIRESDSLTVAASTDIGRNIVREHNAAIAREHARGIAIAAPTTAPLPLPVERGSVRQLDIEIRQARMQPLYTMHSPVPTMVPVEEPSILITILGQGHPAAMLREASARYLDADFPTTVRTV